MDISEAVEVKGHEKCIFETLYNEINCVLRKNQISMKKKIKIFTFAYGQGRGAAPTYGQPDRKMSVFLPYDRF